jgi:crossover junction endodeoxyribonuclease RuvC
MIAGIDPGLSGAVFFLADDGETGEAFDMPVHMLTRGGKAKREMDITGLLNLLGRDPIRHVYVEQVNAMPGQGVSSVFAFGKCYGVILGIITACSVPLTLVPPVQWKRALHVPKAKDAARARASQLLPKAAHQWPLKRHDGRAEAALLALYGLQQMQTAARRPAIELTPTSPAALSAKGA